MAYNKAFNPDALPAHAEPEQAAQMLATHNRRSSPNTRPSSQSPLNPNLQQRPTSPGARRPSPAAIAAQQSYRPTHGQTSNQYHDHQQSNLLEQHQRLSSPPPPSNYGYGPRPHVEPAEPRRSPQPQSTSLSQPALPPKTPAPPDPDSADLWPLFRAANISGTGALTTNELGSALVNADFTPFDSMTIKSLIRMFTTSPPAQPQGPTITHTEFQNLWRFLAAWRELFERFDENRSGRVSLAEFSKALVAFGYRLSQTFVGLLYTTYNDRTSRPSDERRGSRGLGQGQGMSFDLFVQACISLKRMTDVFKSYDDDRDGYVTLSFEEFLTEILHLRE